MGNVRFNGCLSMSVVIQVEGLRKIFRRPFRPPVEALQGISFSLNEGQAFGFVGPNGAGKSTTIKILTGAIRCFEGVALLNGRPVSDYRARKQLGYVPENPYLYDYLTPLELVSMGLRLHGVDRAVIPGRAMTWLEKLGIAAAAKRRIRELSKGMTQRTALAHALAIEPRLLILDEPLSGLDPVGRREVIDLLMTYRTQGGTLLFSSHVLYDVERLADDVIFLNQGKIHAIRPPEDLASEGGYLIRSSGGVCLPGQTHEVAQRKVMTVEREALWSTLAAIEAAGQTIMEIRPRMNVEAAYLSMIQHG